MKLSFWMAAKAVVVGIFGVLFVLIAPIMLALYALDGSPGTRLMAQLFGTAFPISKELAPKLSGWAFGCDICNDVCPWNERFATPTDRPEYQPREAPDTGDPDYFAMMTEDEFGRRFGDTPLSRPGLVRMRRNWRVAFGGKGRDKAG